MEKKYMVVQFGLSKKDKSPYSRCYCLKVDRDGNWAFLDTKDQFFLNDCRPVGTIVTVEQLEV